MNHPNHKSHTSAPRGGIRYLSVCSGIEAASVAWEPLGWSPLAFAEIEKFPAAVLNHHWPAVPNLGDLAKHHEWKLATRPDLIVGGTPCQAFSVAGLRRGLEDPRGNLTLVFLALLERLRPRWVVWENVPGVLSDRTGAFGSFLGGLGQLGYGFAYRVLDAQHFGVPQRRRRVFVVGCLGDWRRAAAVLFEPACLRGDSAPRREAGKEVAGSLGARADASHRADSGKSGGLIPDVANPLTARMHKGVNTTMDEGQTMIAAPLCAANYRGDHAGRESHLVTHSLRGEGFDASEDGTGRGTPLVPVAFSCKDHGADAGAIAPTLRSMNHDASHANGGGQVAVAFSASDYKTGDFKSVQRSMPLTTSADRSRAAPLVVQTAVRRLTPTEAERLQGFPDGHTMIPWRGKDADACPDGPRYKALGNSMAVPVMRWIGRRIESIK